MADPAPTERAAILRRHGGRFARFGGVGALNTLVDFTIYAGLIFVGALPVIANAGGFIVANIGSYFLNAQVTFRENGRPAGRSLGGYFKFFSAHALSLVLSTLIVATLAGPIGPLAAKAVAIAATVLINFALTTLFVFKNADR